VIFCILEGLKGDSALSVCTVAVLGILSLMSSFPSLSNALTIATCSAWLLEHLLCVYLN